MMGTSGVQLALCTHPQGALHFTMCLSDLGQSFTDLPLPESSIVSTKVWLEPRASSGKSKHLAAEVHWGLLLPPWEQMPVIRVSRFGGFVSGRQTWGYVTADCPPWDLPSPLSCGDTNSSSSEGC